MWRTGSLALTRVERKLVWIMGSPRSGSTWLMHLLDEPPRVVTISEPLIGAHIGLLASTIANVRLAQVRERPRMFDLRTDSSYFFAATEAPYWRPELRRLVLRRFMAQVPRSALRCVIHEPNGSEGADVLLSALPKSRLLFLTRDGRDVVDSMFDATRAGSWLDLAFGVGKERAGKERLAYIEEQAYRWRLRTEVVRTAYERHDPALRYFLRYEDLLTNTLSELEKIYQWLAIEAPRDTAERVERHAFSSVPEVYRGTGQFHRAASPGLWRQHLTDDEQRICLDVMGESLGNLGYSTGAQAAVVSPDTMGAKRPP